MASNRTLATEVVIVVFTVLCWFTFAARIYVRWFLVRHVDAGDYLMLLTVCLFTALGGLFWTSVSIGFGNHLSDVSFEQLQIIYKYFFFSEIVYLVSSVAMKLSVAVLLLFFTKGRYCRWLVQGTAAFYTIYGMTATFPIIFQCRPVAYFWIWTLGGTCLAKNTFTILASIHAATSIITDTIFAVIPLYLIWNIQMHWKTKLSVGIILSLGFLTAAVNIARFKFLTVFEDTRDPTYDVYPTLLISWLEIGTGIFAACLATLRPLLRHADAPASKKSSYFTSTDAHLTLDSEIMDPPSQCYSPKRPMRPSINTMPTVRSIEEWKDICNLSSSKLAESYLTNVYTESEDVMPMSWDLEQGVTSHPSVLDSDDHIVKDYATLRMEHA